MEVENIELTAFNQILYSTITFSSFGEHDVEISESVEYQVIVFGQKSIND
jgi:hypothetical protein